MDAAGLHGIFYIQNYGKQQHNRLLLVKLCLHFSHICFGKRCHCLTDCQVMTLAVKTFDLSDMICPIINLFCSGLPQSKYILQAVCKISKINLVHLRYLMCHITSIQLTFFFLQL